MAPDPILIRQVSALTFTVCTTRKLSALTFTVCTTRKLSALILLNENLKYMPVKAEALKFQKQHNKYNN